MIDIPLPLGVALIGLCCFLAGVALCQLTHDR